MSQNKENLKQLPVWLQYTIAAIVMSGVAIAGYLVGRDHPVPDWIERYLIPGLGWFGLVLITIVVIDWLKNRIVSFRDRSSETTQQPPNTSDTKE